MEDIRSDSAACLLPYCTIELATAGDMVAINAVLRHYEHYMAALAAKQFYDENGKMHLYIDEEKICRMRTKLISKIIEFEVDRGK